MIGALHAARHMQPKRTDDYEAESAFIGCAGALVGAFVGFPLGPAVVPIYVAWRLLRAPAPE